MLLRVLAIAVLGVAVAASVACGGRKVVVTSGGTWLGMTPGQSLRLNQLTDEVVAFLYTKPHTKLKPQRLRDVVRKGKEIADEFRAWRAQFKQSLGKNQSAGRIPMQVASTSVAVAEAVVRLARTPTLKNIALYRSVEKRADVALKAITAAARRGLPKGFVARFRRSPP
jgi:hypothetical protein